MFKFINRHTKTQHSPEHPTGASILLSLPLELREQIWAYVLAARSEDHEAHFHVYHVIYGSCLRKTKRKDHYMKRKLSLRTALLRTCKPVHLEAVQMLYDSTTFNLVLCAGRPSPSNNLRGKNNLGPIQDCKRLFERVRKLQIIIQPGKKADAVKYATRIWEFVNMLDFCEGLTSVVLTFNFAESMIAFQHNNSRELFNATMRALHPLARIRE